MSVFLNELEQFYLPTSIAILCTRLNGFKYCYLTRFLFNICLHSEVISSNVWTNCYICTKLNSFKYSYLTLIIQFNIIHSFAHSLWYSGEHKNILFSIDHLFAHNWIASVITFLYARGVMVIVVGNGHGDTSSNPGRGWLHFT